MPKVSHYAEMAIMASGTLPSDGHLPVYYLTSTGRTGKTIYEIYQEARGMYGTSSWILILDVFIITSTTVLYSDIPTRPCIITIIQQDAGSSVQRAAISCQALNADVVKYRRIYGTDISAWY